MLSSVIKRSLCIINDNDNNNNSSNNNNNNCGNRIVWFVCLLEINFNFSIIFQLIVFIFD